MDTSLITLRDREVDSAQFRVAAREVCAALVGETVSLLEQRGVAKESVVAVVVLRAGMAFFDAASDTFPNIPVGVIGLRRDEKTLEPSLYYKNLPAIDDKTTVLILDPMLATGGTADAVVKELVSSGALLTQIYFTGVVAAQTGYDHLAGLIPPENIKVAAVDPELDHDGMIVPGIGDFGDRYFGYKEN